jgi:steroid 5-alpha reductase family enzyme
MYTKSLRIVLVILSMSICSLSSLFALTQHEIDMFTTLETKWRERNQALLQERNALNVDDPRYLELTKAIIEANYKENYYQESLLQNERPL